jgi:hypothetical protein
MWSGGPTRAQWSIDNGKDTAPYTCLKEYVENPTTKENNAHDPTISVAGGVSAAQLIYNASQVQNINPQVFLVLLQKEQSLITDDWPYAVQFERATGNNCPDTAPCNPQYAWLWTQVHNSGAQFNYYVNNFDEYNYAPGWNNILYHPNSACGTQSVYIENAFTAALYIYTPYTPNQAALDNMYGTGDGCSAYGNRNFWRLFNDWFGRSIVPDIFDWKVISTSTDPRYFLVIGNTKRHIPTSDLYYAWKLDQKTLDVVTQSYADSIPTLPPLGRLGYLDGTYFYVDAGKRIRFTTDIAMKSWGVYASRSLAAPLYGVLANMTDGGSASYYATPATPSTTALLVDGVKHTIQSSHVAQWQANPTTLSDNAFQELPTGPTLTNKLAINGVWHIADSNQLIRVETGAQAISWGVQSEAYPNVSATIGEMLPSRLIGNIVASSTSAPWYLTIDGKKYYLPSLNHAKNWGAQEASPLVVSPGLFSSIPSGSGNVPSYIQDSGTSETYIIDGGVRRKADSLIIENLFGGQIAPTMLSNASVVSYPSGANLTSSFVRSPNGNIFVASNGRLLYIPTTAVMGSLGFPRKYSNIDTISQPLATVAYQGEVASPFVVHSGKSYYLQSGYAYELKPSVQDNWTAGRVALQHPQTNFTARYDIIPGILLDNFIQEGALSYVMSDGVFVGVNGSLLPSNLPQVSTYGQIRQSARGLLARSTVESDSRVWLLHAGTKQHILSAETYASYSDGGRLLPVRISPSALESFNTIGSGSNPSVLVSNPVGGFKLLTATGFYGLSDSQAAMALQSTIAPKEIGDSLFSEYTRQRGILNRLVLSGSGKIYILQNGQKRWIVTSTAYSSLLPFGPAVLVDETILSSIADGPPVY